MNERVSFEEYLDQYGSLTYTNVGVSMMPLLRQGKDLFTVRRKGEERCKKGDVVLYRRGERYVLHRIVAVRPDDYVILGDNSAAFETGIRDQDIIGVLTGFVRDGKEHSIEEAGYRMYSAVMMHTIPARIFCRKAYGKLRRLVR